MVEENRRAPKKRSVSGGGGNFRKVQKEKLMGNSREERGPILRGVVSDG